MTKGGRKWWSSQADQPNTGPQESLNGLSLGALTVGAGRLELPTPCL
jgi:hypothetical protein